MGHCRQLIQTGVLDDWREALEHDETESVKFQIELFYRKFKHQREENEKKLHQVISQLGGSFLRSFIEIPEIQFHAVKAILPAHSVLKIINGIKNTSQ
ncbi:MAG: hypothetical protein V1793_15155 [Pseudomonadota bacterium]